MYIAILGRQTDISMAELERRFGAENTAWFSSKTATIQSSDLAIEQLGGTVKAGKVTAEFPGGDWRKISQEIATMYSRTWSNHDGKITLGVSAYGFDTSARDVQRLGIVIKQNLRKKGINLRLIPNTEAELSSATSHHNKLGLSPNKVELLIVRGRSGRVIVAESTGAQNITALARRDQARPKRDAFVGMLPPKLAQIMINLAAGANIERQGARLLDPFCGTGVVLQEAALMGLSICGTDLSGKMVEYSQSNIAWLEQSHRLSINYDIYEGDAMTTSWQQPIDLVVSEVYLGQPFSAPPSPKKLEEVKGNVNHITTTFLKNLHPQIQPGTPLCLAVPAWRDTSGRFTHLPLLSPLDKLGYQRVTFQSVDDRALLYNREDQVVGRELLVLTRA